MLPPSLLSLTYCCHRSMGLSLKVVGVGLLLSLAPFCLQVWCTCVHPVHSSPRASFCNATEMILIIRVRVKYSKPQPRIYSVPASKIALLQVPWWDAAISPCSHNFGIRVPSSKPPEKSVLSCNLKSTRGQSTNDCCFVCFIRHVYSFLPTSSSSPSLSF